MSPGETRFTSKAERRAGTEGSVCLESTFADLRPAPRDQTRRQIRNATGDVVSGIGARPHRTSICPLNAKETNRGSGLARYIGIQGAQHYLQFFIATLFLLQSLIHTLKAMATKHKKRVCISFLFLLTVATAPYGRSQVPDSPTTDSLSVLDTLHQEKPDDHRVDTTRTALLSIQMHDSIDSMYVVIDGMYDEARFVANRDTIPVPSGERKITVATSQTWDVTTEDTLLPDSLLTKKIHIFSDTDREDHYIGSSYPVLKTGSNLLVETDPTSTVFVNGVARGKGPTQMHLDAGTYLVRTQHPVAGTQETTVTVQEAPPRMEHALLYTKPSRRKARLLGFAPGLGQLHKGKSIRGLFVLGGFVLTTAGGIHQHFTYAANNTSYQRAHREYHEATREENIIRWGDETERRFEATRGAYRRRNALIGLAAGLYIYSVLDSWLNTPKGGYRTPMRDSPLLRPLYGANGEVGVRFTVLF